jgi:hypothetical protein
MWNSPRPFNLYQIANEIKYSHRHTGKLFEDTEFSHKDKRILNLAVNYSNKTKHTNEEMEKIRTRNEVENQIVWMRARDWCEKNNLRPYLIKNGIHIDDLTQGKIGNCWIISQFASIANKIYLCDRIFPEEVTSRCKNLATDDYSGFGPEYCGMFHFRLFDKLKNVWVDIVIDE